MLAASILIYAVGKGVFGRTGNAMMAKATTVGGARALPGRQAWLCTAIFCGVTFVAVLPHLGVVLIASSREWYGTLLPRGLTLDNYRAALGHELTVPAIANSLKYASLSTVIDVVLGVAIAYVVVRTRMVGRHVLDFLSMLPLAVPGIVLAFGYFAMSQEGRLFSFLNPVRNPTALLIIAYSVRRLPYVVRSAAAGFQQTSVVLEEAAENMGSPPLRAMIRVTLPLIAANLLAGALLAFAFAMLEVSDSIILAQKMVYFPITKAILELFQLLGDGKYLACALGVWAMVFLGTMVAGVSLLLGKRLGALFRV
jgi:iron(III) transport system permease protein